jgi:hypothetical protein
MESVVLNTDQMIDYLVGYDRDTRTRNWVVRDSQAWFVAFTEEAKAFARKKDAPVDTVGGYVEWLAENYPFSVRGTRSDRGKGVSVRSGTRRTRPRRFAYTRSS